ncbi:MAG: prepilin-type cleavage/methylation domain-containing protein [Snowella sp.]|nr:prepilin-type cleavage/methylation domain-containing protein [Snowella sp.]
MNKFTQWKPSFRAFVRSNRYFPRFNYPAKTALSVPKGITITELLVGTMISAILINLAYWGFAWNRQLYLNDAARNDASQTLKTVFNIVGPTIQQAGEGLDGSFPTILIRPYPIDPPNPNPPNLNPPTFPTFNSEITIRRLISAVKLPICRAVTAGNQTEIFIVDRTITTFPGCDLTDSDNDSWPDTLQQWKNYRNTNGGTVRAFIYDGIGQGEFLNYTGENFYNNLNSSITPIANPTTVETTVSAASLRVTGTLANNYTAGSSAQLLLIEERKYRLGCSDTSIADSSCPREQLQKLQLIINNQPAVDLVNKVGQFTVTATLRQDLTSTTNAKFICWAIPAISGTQTGTPTCNNDPPTTTTAIRLTNPYTWSQVDSINVTVKPKPVSSSNSSLSMSTINTLNNLQETQQFFPRNILNF